MGTCFETQSRNFWFQCLNALSSLSDWCLIVPNSFFADCVNTTPEHMFVLLVNQYYLNQHPLPFGGKKKKKRKKKKVCIIYYPAILPPQNTKIRYWDGYLSALLNREITWYLLICGMLTEISFSYISAQTDWLLSLLSVTWWTLLSNMWPFTGKDKCCHSFFFGGITKVTFRNYSHPPPIQTWINYMVPCVVNCV